MSRVFRQFVCQSLGRYAISLFFVLLAASIIQACPTCKEGLADGGNGANLIRGYAWSIMFMISVPFLLFTSLCGYFYYEVVKARRAAESVAKVA